MNSILPTPTRASVLLQDYLLDKGTAISLSTAQEAVARTRGHKSFQTLQAEAKAQKPTAPQKPEGTAVDSGPLAHLEGLELWSISGREYGDDDDSVDQIWAKDLEEAKQTFIRTVLDLSEEDIADALKHSEAAYFFVTDQLLGKVVNGNFVLNAQIVPARGS